MNILNSKILTVLLSVLSVWTLFSVISVELEKDAAKKEEKNIETKIYDAKQDNKSLGDYIKNLENPEFLEKEARLRLNYKMPGEEVVLIYRNLNSKKASSGENFSVNDPPNYKKWWYYLLR